MTNNTMAGLVLPKLAATWSEGILKMMIDDPFLSRFDPFNCQFNQDHLVKTLTNY